MNGDPETEIGYADALAELEGILADLDGESLDIDVLAAKVERAATLVRTCRERITSARLAVEAVVVDLENTGNGSANGNDDRPDTDLRSAIDP